MEKTTVKPIELARPISLMAFFVSFFIYNLKPGWQISTEDRVKYHMQPTIGIQASQTKISLLFLFSKCTRKTGFPLFFYQKSASLCSILHYRRLFSNQTTDNNYTKFFYTLNIVWKKHYYSVSYDRLEN